MNKKRILVNVRIVAGHRYEAAYFLPILLSIQRNDFSVGAP
jgi:hypothetical protein